MDSSVSLEISTVLNYTYKVNFEYLLKIWCQLISKNCGIEPVIYQSVSENSGIEPVIYRSVSKNSDIEPALLLLPTVLLLETVFYVKIRLNYNVSIEYRTNFRYRSVSNQTWYRTSTSSYTLMNCDWQQKIVFIYIDEIWQTTENSAHGHFHDNLENGLKFYSLNFNSILHVFNRT